MDLNELALSARARNVLRAGGYTTVEDVRAAGPIRLQREPNMGAVTIREIEKTIGGWSTEKTELDLAQRRYDRVKRRYSRLVKELSAAKAKLEALKNPPPKLLTVDEIVACLREQLDRHCTGYVVGDVLRVVVSTRNANWVELEADISNREWGRPHWTLMPLDRFFATYLMAAKADVIRRIDEIEALGAAGNIPFGPWRKDAQAQPNGAA